MANWQSGCNACFLLNIQHNLFDCAEGLLVILFWGIDPKPMGNFTLTIHDDGFNLCAAKVNTDPVVAHMMSLLLTR